MRRQGWPRMPTLITIDPNRHRSPIADRRMVHIPPGGWGLHSREREAVVVSTTRTTGCSGPSLSFTWYDFMGAPAVRLYRDEWPAFAELRDIFDWLATLDPYHDHTVAEVMAGLAALGVRDITAEHRALGGEGE